MTSAMKQRSTAADISYDVLLTGQHVLVTNVYEATHIICDGITNFLSSTTSINSHYQPSTRHHKSHKLSELLSSHNLHNYFCLHRQRNRVNKQSPGSQPQQCVNVQVIKLGQNKHGSRIFLPSSKVGTSHSATTPGAIYRG